MTRNGPDFVVFGVAKGGTTALHEYLSQHPALFLPNKKEPHYFATSGGRAPSYRGPRDAEVVSRMFVSDAAEYRRLFDGAKTSQLTGEASAMYLSYPDALPRLLAWNPDARIILSLRAPAERAFSSFTHLRRDGREPVSDFSEALASEERRIADGWMPIWHYRGLSRYGALLAPLAKLPNPERLHIVIFEEFLRDPDAHLRAICSFLGVDSDFEFRRTLRKNKSGEPRSAVLHRVHHWLRWGGGKGVIKRIIPSAFRRSAKARAVALLEEHNLQKAEPNREMMQQLRHEFEPDVNFVETLLGRPIPSWRSSP